MTLTPSNYFPISRTLRYVCYACLVLFAGSVLMDATRDRGEQDKRVRAVRALTAVSAGTTVEQSSARLAVGLSRALPAVAAVDPLAARNLQAALQRVVLGWSGRHWRTLPEQSVTDGKPVANRYLEVTPDPVVMRVLDGGPGADMGALQELTTRAVVAPLVAAYRNTMSGFVAQLAASLAKPRNLPNALLWFGVVALLYCARLHHCAIRFVGRQGVQLFADIGVPAVLNHADDGLLFVNEIYARAGFGDDGGGCERRVSLWPGFQILLGRSTKAGHEHVSSWGAAGAAPAVPDRAAAEHHPVRDTGAPPPWPVIDGMDRATGLPDEQVIRQQLTELVAARPVVTSGQRATVGALAFVVLRDFAGLTAKHGSDVANQLLLTTADRLRMAVSEHDVVAGLGDATLAVLLKRIEHVEDAREAMASVLRRLRANTRIGGINFAPSACAGMVMILADDDPQHVWATAQGALASAAEHVDVGAGEWDAGSGAQVDALVLANSSDDNTSLAEELRAALARHEFFIEYQPLIDLRSGACVGAEALVRWQHPVRGVLYPDSFVAEAERSSLIEELGLYVVNSVVRQVVHWQATPAAGLRVSINVSPRQLLRREAVGELLAPVRALGVGDQITFELTESLLVQDMELVEYLGREARALGAQLALDDFGTGYASLATLRQLPFDILKIDRCFVAEIERNNDDLALLATLASIGRIMGLKVVVEGVETAAQAQLVTQAGCDFGQGYLFGRPAPAAALPKMAAPAQAENLRLV